MQPNMNPNLELVYFLLGPNKRPADTSGSPTTHKRQRSQATNAIASNAPPQNSPKASNPQSTSTSHPAPAPTQRPPSTAVPAPIAGPSSASIMAPPIPQTSSPPIPPHPNSMSLPPNPPAPMVPSNAAGASAGAPMGAPTRGPSPAKPAKGNRHPTPVLSNLPVPNLQPPPHAQPQMQQAQQSHPPAPHPPQPQPRLQPPPTQPVVSHAQPQPQPSSSQPTQPTSSIQLPQSYEYTAREAIIAKGLVHLPHPQLAERVRAMEAQFGPLKELLRKANDTGNQQAAQKLRDEIKKKQDMFQTVKTIILKSVAQKQRQQQLQRQQQQQQEQQGQGQGQGGQQAGLSQNQAGPSNTNQQPPKPTHPSFLPQSQPQQSHGPAQIQQSNSNNGIGGSGVVGLTPGAGGLTGPNMGGLGSLGPAFSMSPNLAAAGLAPGPNVHAGPSSNRGHDQQHPQQPQQQQQPQHNRAPSMADIQAIQKSLAAHAAQNPSADGRIHNLPPDLMAQMQKLMEHRGVQPPGGQAPNNTLAALLSQMQQHQNQHDGSGGAGNGMGGLGGLGAPGQLPVNLTTVNRGNKWMGFVSWSGTDTATQEKKEVRAQIVATGVPGSAEMYVLITSFSLPSFVPRLRSS